MKTILHVRPKRTTTDRPALLPGRILTVGYCLLVVSLLVFQLAESKGIEDDNLSLFFVHYGLAICYILYLITQKSFGLRRSWSNEHLSKTIVLLLLFLVSAYALNRSIPVFESSAPWLCVYLVVTSVTFLLNHYIQHLPGWLTRMQLVVNGSMLMLYLYLSIYTLNWWIFGLIGIAAIGIGGHVFVPTFLLAVLIVQIRKWRTSLTQRAWLAAGAGLSLLFVAAFAVEWKSRIESFERINNNSVLSPADDLPVWVRLGQQVQDDWITTRALKSDLVYTTWDRFRMFDFFPRMSSWNEPRQHDPLVLIGSMFAINPLTHEDRIRILQVNPQLRHAAEERLWNGDNLATSYVVTDVDIFPALRLAYTEKYLNIRNSSKPGWRSTQEAIYTFKLPEGSVVTSLSLWINGVEEKGILTSKHKADNAYKTIVGVEQRDPSVVHWQEGNTVSVRVFPCTPDEERRFRIGITSPLEERNGKLRYGNVAFEGPSSASARETMRIRLHGTTQQPDFPGFTQSGSGDYVREGPYDPDATVTLSADPLGDNRFSFDGYQYAVERRAESFGDFDVRSIFLDLNQSWTQKDLNVFRSLVDQFPVYVFDGVDRIRLTPDNWDKATTGLRKNNYSIFPFHKLPGRSVVVTKGTECSPRVKDFRNSAFARSVTSFFASGNKAFVFDLGEENSNYLNTLRELRALSYARGSADRFMDLLIEKRFPVYRESDDRVYLHDARLWITKKPIGDSSMADNAPDHLARLFAYNNIMRKAGQYYMNDDVVRQDLVDEAAMAYVVSPVSSLIVLETKADYERFDIEQSKNSLLNATKQASGAVPEPQEWALIAMFLLVALYAFRARLTKWQRA